MNNMFENNEVRKLATHIAFWGKLLFDKNDCWYILKDCKMYGREKHPLLTNYRHECSEYKQKRKEN